MIHTTTLALLLALPSVSPQDPPAIRPLTVEDGDSWNTIQEPRLSQGGAWLTWRKSPADGDDGTLRLARTDGSAALEIPRGRGAQLTADERFAAAIVDPPREATRAWRKAKKEEDGEPGPEPRTGLVVLDLETRLRAEVAHVKSFAIPADAGRWLAYLKHAPEKAPKKDRAGEEPAEKPEEKPEEKAGEEPAADGQKEKKKHEKDPGTELVLRDLERGVERVYADVAAYAFAPDGSALVYAASTKEGAADGVFRVELATETPTEPAALLAGPGEYKSLAFPEDGGDVAFLTDRDDRAADEPLWALYLAREADDEARVLAAAGTPGVPEGWTVSPHRAPSFTRSGTRVLFGTAPKPEPEPEEVPEEDEVVLDVWSWTDDRIQPVQLAQLEDDLKRSHLAVAHLVGDGATVVQLGSLDLPSVSVGAEGDGRWALGVSDLPYRAMRQWDPAVLRDAWRIDVLTGARERVIVGQPARPTLSSGGRFAVWWDGRDRHWWCLDLEGDGAGARRLTEGIDQPLWNELHDTPTIPRGYGMGGWLAGDAAALVYDRYDVWLVDPTGARAPSCVTDGVGRRAGLRFRRVDLEPDEEAIPALAEMLLSAFHLETKRAGFWRDWLVEGGEPVELLMADARFSTPVRAKGGDVLRFTREDFSSFPDLWAARVDLAEPRQLSDANPQRAEFRWGTAELVRWSSDNGDELQGILYKPEEFDPRERYPLLVYFYERNSDNLHAHNAPIPSRSTIRFPYYTSNGYCVFVPDIPYRTGYPGDSCAEAVLPGVRALVDAGFVDPGRIGVQGHSWGGYQIAYLVTRTEAFAAAVAGAPVSNMTSAYGGIRYSSGLSRQFQYEGTQSRIGDDLWAARDLYIHNSPVFFADRVETPLLMLHNDEDGAVPWTQGIEMFLALKRLGKPTWLLNYNGEAHGLTRHANRRDYAIRMSQFFDHYLRDAPAPPWMTEGVPAVRKGRDLGF